MARSLENTTSMNYNFLNFIVLPIELELMDCKVVSTLTWLHVLNY